MINKIFKHAFFVALVVLSALGSFSVFELNSGVAEARVGCNIQISVGWVDIDCNELKSSYPAFTVDPTGCYYSWEKDGGGYTPPVKYPCDNVPAFNAPPTLPQGNTPGAGPAASVGTCKVVKSPGIASVKCDDLKVVYPSFDPKGGECYYSWDSGTGPTPPVKLECDKTFQELSGAASNPILPEGNNPGGSPAGEGGDDSGGESGSAGGPNSTGGSTITITDTDAVADTCGSDGVEMRFNIGCRGQGNPIVDMFFAIIRILSIGVGIVLTGSLVVAGIQYTTSAGDPNATAAAIQRVQNTVIALVLFMLTYAIINWLIPGQIFATTLTNISGQSDINKNGQQQGN